VSHLFFEGELAELLPNLDIDDRHGLDLGLAVGRQPISFQEGLLINDFVDAVGVTQNNLRPGGLVNLRFTGLYGWNQINRNTPSALSFTRNLEGAGAHLVGGFTEIDWRSTTAAFDVIYVRGGEFTARGNFGSPVVTADRVTAGDGVYAGISLVGRPGSGAFNTALRVLTSVPVGARTPAGGVAGGGLASRSPTCRMATRRHAVPSSSPSSRGHRTTRRISSTATRSTRSTSIAPPRSTRPFPGRWRVPACSSLVPDWGTCRVRCRPPPTMRWGAPLGPPRVPAWGSGRSPV